jgi:hypothetical protein
MSRGDRTIADLVLQRNALAHRLLAADDQRTNGMRLERLYVHGV